MLLSMTGFGRAQTSGGSTGSIVVEIQSLNHKFLEVECRLPEGFQSLEEPIRSMVRGQVRRGRVKVWVAAKSRTPKAPVVFQADVARQYVGQLRSLRKRLGVAGDVTLDMVLGLPQVMMSSESEALPARWGPSMKQTAQKALTQMVWMRRREGQRLEKVLTALLGMLKSLSLQIKRRVPVAQKELRRRLSEKIQAAVSEAPAESVVAQAVALIQATDVSEELARIDSHLKALAQAAQGKADNPGRTIDFLAQELHREVNTLGSKVRDGFVVKRIVAMKNQIEKLREQAANVE